MPDRSRMAVDQPPERLETKVNAAGHEGLTPLMLQAAAGRADVVRVLIKHGAEVNAFNAANKGSGVSFAVHNGYDDVARILREAGAREREQ